MAHLGAACEDGHFNGYLNGSIGSGVSVDTTAGHFLAPNRCGIAMTGTGTVSVLASKSLTSAQSSFWLGARVWLNSASNGPTPFLNICGPTGRVLIAFAPVSLANDPWQVSKVSAGGTQSLLFTTAGGFTAAPAQPDKLDVFISYGNPGTITAYLNGTALGSYNGDVTWDDGVTVIGSVQIGCPCARSSVTATWSGLFMDTNSTLDRDAYFRPPASAGDTDQWTGGVAAVGNETVSASSYDTTNSAGQTQLYRPGVAAPIGSIVRVVDVIEATQGVSPGFGNLQFVRRIAGTTHNSPSQPIPASPGIMEFSWETNPATGAAWTPADVNASGYQIGYESEA